MLSATNQPPGQSCLGPPSDPLSWLPPELGLEALSYLDPPALACCCRVSRAWNRLASQDELWRTVAINSGYVSPEIADIRVAAAAPYYSRHWRTRRGHTHSSNRVASVVAAPTESQHPVAIEVDPALSLRNASSCGYYGELASFRDLCTRRWCLDRTWSASDGASPTPPPTPSSARLTPSMRNIDAAPPRVEAGIADMFENGGDVWRIKLDPVDETIISTGQGGGVRVCCLHTGECLWRIPSELTRTYPHLEFSRGWLIFDRIGLGHFEIWRAERLMREEGETTRTPRRGVFHQWDILHSPRPIRAYRFKYPTLAAATQDGHVLLFDVPSREVIQDIDVSESIHASANVNYIDFSDDGDYVFLVGVGAKAVTIFSRRSGARIWSLAEHFDARWPGPRTWELVAPPRPSHSAGYASLQLRSLRRRPAAKWQTASPQNMAQLLMAPLQSWNAVHPDERTGTLCLLGHANVLLIPNYRELLRAWEGAARTGGNALPPLPEGSSFEMHDVILKHSASEVGRGTMWDEMPAGQLCVQDGRAFAVLEDVPYLLDLDPGRILGSAAPSSWPSGANDATSTQSSSIASPPLCASLALYTTSYTSLFNPRAGPRFSSSLFGCSCVQMDAGAVYAVEQHETLLSQNHAAAVGASTVASPTSADAGAAASEGDEWDDDSSEDSEAAALAAVNYARFGAAGISVATATAVQRAHEGQDGVGGDTARSSVVDDADASAADAEPTPSASPLLAPPAAAADGAAEVPGTRRPPLPPPPPPRSPSPRPPRPPPRTADYSSVLVFDFAGAARRRLAVPPGPS